MITRSIGHESSHGRSAIVFTLSTLNMMSLNRVRLFLSAVESAIYNSPKVYNSGLYQEDGLVAATHLPSGSTPVAHLILCHLALDDSRYIHVHYYAYGLPHVHNGAGYTHIFLNSWKVAKISTEFVLYNRNTGALCV